MTLDDARCDADWPWRRSNEQKSSSEAQDQNYLQSHDEEALTLTRRLDGYQNILRTMLYSWRLLNLHHLYPTNHNHAANHIHKN